MGENQWLNQNFWTFHEFYKILTNENDLVLRFDTDSVFNTNLKYCSYAHDKLCDMPVINTV